MDAFVVGGLITPGSKKHCHWQRRRADLKLLQSRLKPVELVHEACSTVRGGRRPKTFTVAVIGRVADTSLHSSSI
jgi:hypothetical protein